MSDPIPMQDPPSEQSPQARTRYVILAWAALVVLLAAFAYREALTNDFTGGDTVALIEFSRIRSFDDFVQVLMQPMLPTVTKFYRPTANLSYALDDALWGFNAYGFHVTDVAIHAIVCGLIVLVVQRFSKSTVAAVVAGVAFALHPILMETVPTATRRQDTLAGLFMLLTLYWLPRGTSGKFHALSWVPSLAACALALGAKEGSVILPALVFALDLALPAETVDSRPRWLLALRKASPFLVLALCFVAWRSWILGGAGGNEHSWAWTLDSIPALGLNICNFAGDLVYPLRVVFHPYLSLTDRLFALCAALGFFCLIPRVLRAWNATLPRPSRVWLNLVLLVAGAILLFPVVSLWIRGVVEQAYRNEGWPALASMIDTPRKQPVEIYVWKAFDAVRLAATGALLCTSALLAIAWMRARSVVRTHPPRARLMTFAVVWIALQLALFLAVQRYHPWNAYVPAIPFCIFVGLGFAEGLRENRYVAFAFGGLVVWLAAFSPLLRGLDVWAANGKFNTMLMAEFARVTEAAPSGSRLVFYDLPNLNFSSQVDGPEPTSAFTFNPPSMYAWVKTHDPQKALQVEVKGHFPTLWPIAGIRMESQALDDHRVAVRIRVLPVLQDAGTEKKTEK